VGVIVGLEPLSVSNAPNYLPGDQYCSATVLLQAYSEPCIRRETAMLTPDEDWRAIAEQASKEKDPEKLLMLVKQLCSAFDDGKRPALPPERDEGMNCC